MGCQSSTLQQVQHEPVRKGGSFKRELTLERPKPLIFAIIRNGHEVIRGGLQDIEAFLQRGELELATEEWRKLRKWWQMHRKLELGVDDGETTKGFLRLLDKHCEEIATKEKFYQGYDAIVEREEELNGAFETEDLFQIKAFFFDFKDELLDLLTRQDEKLMPCVDDMADRRLDLKKFMKRDVLAGIARSFGFEFFVRYAVEILDKHHGGMPRVRVYGYALWAVATRKEWQQWKVWIQESVSESAFQELEEVIKQEGK
mmetsp:Transcript_32863/g.68503  ORF Transcript_32863/g.68503 Transcript_32863/m.68503 type:complete len:258 (-) Transcript_32863:146-919(-)|eukprot:CAMPEP_0172445124 /NCGR_PEP_ID=MMETSP1065-20121228/5066_1 /TAXON_ID=265537 /ORGANISM="Amphiprora paludosa, Strain CCMP125" /LENGTH=257 /DNA_ID=CAMNT_0013195919 /DNA_START=50 /DNA_END=823 /DNA_ORIENTATION=-